MLLFSVFGPKVEEDSKKGKYNGLSLAGVVDILKKSELAGHMYQGDAGFINNFVLDNRKKASYDRADVLDLAKMLIKRCL